MRNPLPAEETEGVRKGLLARLRDDVRGNTLAIVGAALIPLTAMIGSGVDMSRAYMAKTRLQSACDAASLAGRRIMQNDTLSQSVRDEATRFFRFNFPDRLYDTASFTPQVTRPSGGTVRVTANTTIPTTVMGMFGFTNLPLEVSCDATLNFVNTDVMLVLDVTGSMDETIDGTRKIVSLRNAVMALYDQLAPIQTQLQSNGLRLRYGAVPYSSTVNVGALVRSVNNNYISPDSEYQTRVAVYDTPATWTQLGAPGSPVTQVSGSALTQSECDLYGRNLIQRGQNYNEGPPEWVRTYSNNEAQGVDWGWSGSGDTSGSRRACRRRYVQIPADVTSWGFTQWSYEAENVDTSTFRGGSAITIAVDAGGGNGPGGTVPEAGRYDVVELAQIGSPAVARSSVPAWNGCIEERQTVDTITASSGFSIPANAYDLNINMVPNPADDTTKWRPMWPQISWLRDAGTTSATTGYNVDDYDLSACPAAARRLAAMTRTDMQNYVNALSPTGSTYHDIGMIWGARLVSNAGVFGDSPDQFAGMPVSRHIIFMTDGQLAPTCYVYGAYGMEQNAERVTGDSSCPQQYDRHLQRFRMICNAAKSLNVSIWVIAFGTTLSSDMQQCASNANQASTAANQTVLIDRFRQIGSQIGALRLTQ
jgi:Flp pilus assembly protein TadG